MATKDCDLKLEASLEPFYVRAAQAEERLSRLEAILGCKKDYGNEQSTNIVELQKELEGVRNELLSVKNKSQKLEAENEKLKYRIIHLNRSVSSADQELHSSKSVLLSENEKLKYRIIHLVQAVRQADLELKSTKGHGSSAMTEAAMKLENLRL